MRIKRRRAGSQKRKEIGVEIHFVQKKKLAGAGVVRSEFTVGKRPPAMRNPIPSLEISRHQGQSLATPLRG
jgi:hypothetical protein